MRPRNRAYAEEAWVEQAASEEGAERHRARPGLVAELQQALLPAALPVLPGAWIAARYLAAGRDEAAGGDWFDVVPLTEGRVALVVGDVAGHGASVAAAMSQLRAVLRHMLMTEPDPAAAVRQADAFAAAEPTLHAATVCVATLDPAQRRLCYVTCGHPVPLVVAQDGTCRFLPGTGAGPLGTGHRMARPAAPGPREVELEPGDVVLLYSDGLVERPGRTLAEGMAELAAVATEAVADRTLPGAPPVTGAASSADRVCQLTVDLLTKTGCHDDVTALAAQVLTAAPRPLAVELPAEPGAVITLRRALEVWLNDIGVATADRQVLELAVTECVTNTVEHAYRDGRTGSVQLEADLGADGWLEARVSDRGRWHSPDTSDPYRGRGLMLARQISDQLKVSHPPQPAAEPYGARGTVVTLRHRLHRPAMLGAQAESRTVPSQVRAPLTAELVTGGAVPCLRVDGPVDITNAERFASEILAASRVGVLPLTVDLSAVTLLASSGVRVLYQFRDQLADHGQELTLVAAPGSPAAAVLDLICLPYTA